jgi:hypothetical protein
MRETLSVLSSGFWVLGSVQGSRFGVPGSGFAQQAPRNRTRNLAPGTSHPEPRTRNPEPGTSHPEPRTPNLAPGTPNPEPNPEPRTQNPEPRML